MSSSLIRKSIITLKEEGLKSFYKKVKRWIAYRNPVKSQKTAESFSGKVRDKYNPYNMAQKWLSDNRKSFNNPFYMLLKYLVTFNEQIDDIEPVACSDYRNYFVKQYQVNNFPFKIISKSVDDREDIIQFISEFDHVYLAKMVQSVFIGLIEYLSRQRDSINLLDFGSGQTCGMYGENGRFLFTAGNVNINAVSFWAIDDLYEPTGSIFKNATYRKCNIVSFEPHAKYDLITGHHVLEHCYDWNTVVGHISGLLKKDGYLYVSLPRFGGFYDTAYRLMSPFDHCADFDLPKLKSTAERAGLEMCLSDIYVDPNSKFDWICSFYPELVNKEITDCFYDLCVSVDSKLLLGYHHYGYYIIFRKAS